MSFCHSGLDLESIALSQSYINGGRINSGMTLASQCRRLAQEFTRLGERLMPRQRTQLLVFGKRSPWPGVKVSKTSFHEVSYETLF